MNTEIAAAGTSVQLEGLRACCVSEVQSIMARTLASMDQPADGQALRCGTCDTVLVFKAGAWRSRNYMSSTFPEFDYETD